MHPKAGEPAPKEILENIPELIENYYKLVPDPSNPAERVKFGTSGHRGTANKKSFNETHILAITQALCDYRKEYHITGPVFLGRDTHALSEPAQKSAISVLAANEVHTYIAKDDEFTPTPLVSFAIIEYNEKNDTHTSDGIVITPSHNPPSDGGFKYNPPNGGPADTNVTNWIEKRANKLIEEGLKDVKHLPYEEAIQSHFIEPYDFITPYVEALPKIVNLEAIRRSGIKIGVDPLGGSSLGVYRKIKEMHYLNL